MIPPMDVTRAVVCHGTHGTVTVVDPQSPLTVTITTSPHHHGGPRRITSVNVTLPDGHPGRITTSVLARLPLQRIAALTTPTRHPDDRHWIATADQRPPGERSWPDTHWPAVAAVYRWANASGRPGGGRRAIAEFWQVTQRPTAERWITRCRRLGLMDPVESGRRQLRVVPLRR